jgi:hypothetical protein
MVRCPSCGSYRVFVIVTPERRARCIHCGAKWTRVPATVGDDLPLPTWADHPSARSRAVDDASPGLPTAAPVESAPERSSSSEVLSVG